MAEDGLHKAFNSLNDILYGGSPRDGIPPIDEPSFKTIAKIEALGPSKKQSSEYRPTIAREPIYSES